MTTQNDAPARATLDDYTNPIWYMAHRFSGDPRNIAIAKVWLQALNLACAWVDFTAPWIPWVETLSDRDMRERGLRFDLETIRAGCVGVVCVGDGMSSGMMKEASYCMSLGRPALTLFHLGKVPPARDILTDALAEILPCPF